VLDVNNHQGKFGQDYVRVLASAAGVLVLTPDLDHDGIDVQLRWPGRVGAAASPAIDVQVKSWSRPRRSGGAWRFGGLDEVQFNQLADASLTVPRYLFLVVVPPDAQAYSEIRADGMLLRYQGFYASLRDETPISEPSRRRRRSVDVPIGNVLTVGSLRALLRGAYPRGTSGSGSADALRPPAAPAMPSAPGVPAAGGPR
jgi:hypothetical protein